MKRFALPASLHMAIFQSMPMKVDPEPSCDLKTSTAQLLVELSNRLAGLSFGIIRPDHDDWIMAPFGTLYVGSVDFGSRSDKSEPLLIGSSLGLGWCRVTKTATIPGWQPKLAHPALMQVPARTQLDRVLAHARLG